VRVYPRTHGRSAVLVDIAFAALCVLVLWFPLAGGPAWRTTLQLVLIGLVLGGVVARWRWPKSAASVVFVATILAAGLGLTHDPFVAVGWALYPLAAARGGGPRRVAIGCAVALGALLLGLTVTAIPGAEATVRYLLLGALALGGSIVLGDAAHRQLLEAERAAQSQTAVAVAEERLRVAREVHDIVSHSLGTIGVRAGVARLVPTLSYDELRKELGSIETTSRAALSEMGAALGSIRESEPAPKLPQPGVEELSGIVAGANASGIVCEARIQVSIALPMATQVAVYRIVQEAVTNVIRHAPGARCCVTVTGADRLLTIEISDDGPGRDLLSADGHGLLGIRERASLLGGSVVATNRPAGGYLVRVEAPVLVEAREPGRDAQNG
jgi:signal transduction histidine kinase